MAKSIGILFGAVFLVGALGIARGDIVVGTDGKYTDGKIISSNDKQVVIQPDGGEAGEAQYIDRSKTSRVVYTDEHGAMIPGPGEATAPATQPVKWEIPAEPGAPALGAAPSPSYYVIPLHGEVGNTVLASALEKSFADAVPRKPTVVVLDIDSPGGSVSEAEKIIQIIHHYNKQLRIVALTNQDLSAAAILSLSVKNIYVKPTSTIGAATSFVPGHPDLSAKVEEKMQSAWRAVARNSAEEGGHDPLLSEAMIDNDLALHLETVDGKPVVKEGPGDKMLCKKGKILTLTSHEALECGLAAGDAEDFAALGEAMGFANWTECKGLGTILADYLPVKDEVFESQLKKVMADFSINIEMAASADPTQENNYVVFQNGAQQQQQRMNRFGPSGQPGGPQMMHGPQNMGPPQRTQVTQTTQDTQHWKQRSLACVVAIDKSEQNLQDAISLSDAFGESPDKDALNDLLTKISAIRAKIYEDRNKFGAGQAMPIQQPAQVQAPLQQPGQQPGQAPGQQMVVRPIGQRARAATLPDLSPEDTAAQMKKIEAGWQAVNAKPTELLPSMESPGNIKDADGSTLLGRGHKVDTTESYKAPVTFRIVAMTSNNDFRIAFPTRLIIFNWEMKPDQLRVDNGADGGGVQPKDGVGRLPANEWVGIELVVHADELVIYVNGEERFREKADFSTLNKPFSIQDHTGLSKIKSVSVIQQ